MFLPILNILVIMIATAGYSITNIKSEVYLFESQRRGASHSINLQLLTAKAETKIAIRKPGCVQKLRHSLSSHLIDNHLLYAQVGFLYLQSHLGIFKYGINHSKLLKIRSAIFETYQAKHFVVSLIHTLAASPSEYLMHLRTNKKRSKYNSGISHPKYYNLSKPH